ncbi:MAG: cation diffusion facilitator family transporter [Sphaerochaetaceae bacterium]|nr:cation diffusion facilitator family transporter [Sphaerochaetaceae bacterium]
MLKELFIKDYKNTQDTKVRNAYIMLAGIFGIITNLLLGILKIFIGMVSHSISIMADAVNNLSDCASIGLTIAGSKLAAKVPDSDHPYGHARYEYIFGFAIGELMLIMGILFAKESITKIIHPQELDVSLVTFLILGFAIVVKLLQSVLYGKYGKAINSGSLKANAEDARNDIVSTSGILVALIVMKFVNINIDGFVGLVVSIFVIISSIGTIKDQIEPIIGIKPTKERVQLITEKLLSYPVVLGIHDLVLHNYGVHNDYVTVHVEIDSTMDVLEAHDLIDNIENDFKGVYCTELTIHMDPIVIGNPKFDEIKARVAEALKSLDPELQFHDMRFVEGPTHTNVVFDCVVSPDQRYEGSEIAKYLSEHVQWETALNYVVEIDIAYC